MTIHRLTSDFTNTNGILSQIKGGLESPTIIKENGGYYLMMSTTTGELSNSAVFSPWH